MAATLSFDPGSSRFILIGTSRYELDPHNLQPLPAIHKNLDVIESILTNHEIVGVPSGNITVIRDPQDKAVLAARLVPVTRQAKDLLFVYYAGHGLIGRETKRLFLGTVQTTEQNADFDGYDFNELRLAMDASPATKRILILDCCFSGNAIDGVMGGTEGVVDTSIAIRSTYAIASAPPNRLSIAEAGEKHTAFTGELVELLENGTGGPEQFLSIDAIYEALRKRIALKPRLPEPRRSVKYDGNMLIIARNRVGSVALEKQLSNLYRLVSETTEAIGHRIDELVDRLENVEKARTVTADSVRQPAGKTTDILDRATTDAAPQKAPGPDIRPHQETLPAPERGFETTRQITNLFWRTLSEDFRRIYLFSLRIIGPMIPFLWILFAIGGWLAVPVIVYNYFRYEISERIAIEVVLMLCCPGSLLFRTFHKLRGEKTLAVVNAVLAVLTLAGSLAFIITTPKF